MKIDIDIDDLTLGQMKEINSIFAKGDKPEIGRGNPSPLSIGNNVYIRRSGEYHYLGTVEYFNQNEIVLSSASWVSDGMRLHDFMTHGLKTDQIEIEPFQKDAFVSVPREKSEVITWSHELPVNQIG